MTINELEQAVRNLMVSQPMISAGPMGGVVTSAVNILDSFRNLIMAVQNYPMQDNFKFSMMSEIQRLENTMTMSVCQSLQEKGINIMAYMMPTQPMMGNPYMPQPMQTGMPQNMQSNMPQSNQPNQGTHSHLAFNQPMNGPRFNTRPAGQFPQPYGAGSMSNPQFSQPYGAPQNAPMGNGQMPPRPMMNNMAGARPMGAPSYPPKYPQPPMRGPVMNGSKPNPVYPRTQAPAQPVKMNEVQPEPVLEQEVQEVEIPKPVVQPSKATIKTQELSTAKPTVTKASSQKPALLLDADIEESQGLALVDDNPPAGPAAGRDYLLQLLKK